MLLRKPKGITATLRATKKRRQAKVDRVVYTAVDARDGMRCRLCGDYCGVDIHRHHIVNRSLGGETSTANVISLCANCHLGGVHGKRIRLAGNADTRNAHGVLCGVRLERATADGWSGEGYR